MKAVLLALLFSVPAFGDFREPVPPGHSVKKIVQIANDRDPDITYLSVLLNARGRIAGFYGATAFPPDTFFTADRNIFPLAEVESAEGATLLETQGKRALILLGKLNREKQEGRFAIRFLANGIFNSYKSCDFDLRRAGQGWIVKNAYNGETVREVKVITHAVGITTLRGLCPEE